MLMARGNDSRLHAFCIHQIKRSYNYSKNYECPLIGLTVCPFLQYLRIEDIGGF